MTHVLSPYAVDIAALRSLVGSGDERRLHSLDLTDEDLLEEIDEVDESHLGWTADPVRSTLRGLVLGEEPDRRPAHLYGYCLEVLCRILPCSTPLPSRAWTGIDFLLFMHVKAELQKAGSAFDPATLIRTGPPVPLPPAGETRRIGHLEAEQVPEILADLDRIDEASIAPDVLSPIRQLHGWLRECARTGRGLVTYYH